MPKHRTKSTARINPEAVGETQPGAVIDQIVSERNARGWTVFIDYQATGEGRHVWYLRSGADSESNATAEFKKTFFANASNESWVYWSQGMEVHNRAFWPSFLNSTPIPPDRVEMHWKSL